MLDVSSSVSHLPSVDEADANAKAMVQHVHQVIGHCEIGLDAIVRTISDIYRAKESAQGAVSVICNLGFRLDAMNELCATISRQSHELTVVAINAQIMAAQNNEQSPAFQVIAHKVETLGKSIEANIRDIGQLITTIRDESRGALDLVERSAHSVDPGVEQANTAERALNHIQDRCTQMGTLFRASNDAIVSWEKAQNGMQQVALVMQPLCAEADALAAWATSAQRKTEHTRNELIGKAIEQWASVGGQLLDFAKRMDQSVQIQEQTYARMGHLLGNQPPEASSKPKHGRGARLRESGKTSP